MCLSKRPPGLNTNIVDLLGTITVQFLAECFHLRHCIKYRRFSEMEIERVCACEMDSAVNGRTIEKEPRFLAIARTRLYRLEFYFSMCSIVGDLIWALLSLRFSPSFL